MSFNQRPFTFLLLGSALLFALLTPPVAAELPANTTVAAGSGSGTGSGSGSGSGSGLAAPAAASTAAPTTPPAPAFEELVGELVTIRRVALSTKVAGRLASVPLFVGDTAKAGAVIATLETRDFELALAQAQALLEVTKARLKLMETGSRPEEKQQAEESLRQAKANMENAQADLVRTRDLFQTGAVSKSALDAAQARATVTEAQYAAARQQKSIVDQGPRIEDKEGTRAQLRQQEATFELARLQLDYATLKAPFDGMVAQRSADEGAFVTTTMPVYTFIQVDPIFAVIDCPERIVPKLKPGMQATFTLDALPGQQFTGTLERLPATIDSKTRTARAEFVVKNPEGKLKAGMFIRCSLKVQEAEQGAGK